MRIDYNIDLWHMHVLGAVAHSPRNDTFTVQGISQSNPPQDIFTFLYAFVYDMMRGPQVRNQRTCFHP